MIICEFFTSHLKTKVTYFFLSSELFQLKFSELNQQHISFAKSNYTSTSLSIQQTFSFLLCAIGFGAILQGLWLFDSFFSFPCGAFQVKIKKVVLIFKHSKSFTQLRQQNQSQRGKARFWKKKFTPLKIKQ